MSSMLRHSRAVETTQTACRNEMVGQRRHRPDELQVVGEANRAAGNGERSDEDGLEDEEERHQRAEAERLEGFAQVQVAAAAARERRPELRIDKSVGQSEEEAGDPRVDHVRPAHCRHHERNGEERTDAHHRDDVGCCRLQQAHAAAEDGLGRLRARRARHQNSTASSCSAFSREGTSGFRASAATSSVRLPVSAAFTAARS